MKVRVRDRGWQIKRDKSSELRATDRDTGDKYFLVVFIRRYFKHIRVRSTEKEELEVFNLLHGNKSQAGTSSTSYQKDGKSDDKDVIMNAVQYRRASLQVYH